MLFVRTTHAGGGGASETEHKPHEDRVVACSGTGARRAGAAPRSGQAPRPFPSAVRDRTDGLLKLAVQMAGLPGGDRAVLLAFVSNEWKSRERYGRYAARPYPPELAALLQRHAADEARHHAWACGALERLGCGADTSVGRATQAFARFHGITADAVEALGRTAREATIRAFRPA